MGTRVFRSTIWAATITGDTDKVLMDCPVPAECVQKNVWGEMHMNNVESDPLEWQEAIIYALEGWVIPVPDPDTALNLETLWDRFIPKDQEVASGAFDLDTVASAAASFYDLGEINLDAIMDMSNLRSENQWYSRKKMLTWANNRVGLVAGTPDVSTYADVHKIRARRDIPAEFMSWSLLAAAMPGQGDVDASRSTYASEGLWLQTKYIDVVLEQAWMELVGLTEAGAETPWTDAALAVQELVEPEPVYVGAGGAEFQPTPSANFFCHGTFELEVPGRKEVSVISGGR